MKKLSLLVALVCASVLSFAQEKNVNFALASNGSSAKASSGDAALAIDGNTGTRWESAANDDEWWSLDLGQVRTFNTIKILWEGAFCSEFEISISSDGDSWTVWHSETALAASGWQTIYKETSSSARYVKYQGIKRATTWGQSFFEFQLFLGDKPKVALSGLSIVAHSDGENDVNLVIDGKDNTEWQGRPAGVTGADEESRTFDAWFVVDLGDFYTVEQIDIHFEGACSQEYHIDFSLDNTAWTLGYNFVGAAGVNNHTDELVDLDNNEKVRYIRFWSTKAATEWGMKIYEFTVYGKEWVDSGDTEAPVMTSATLASKTWNSVVIAVAATDNGEVTKFHVVEAAKSIDTKIIPNDGKITVSGLTAETAYNFVITAIDAAGNESENSKELAVTTDVRVIVPAAAAPAPTWPAAQVKSLYSDAYEFAPASLVGYNQDWWQNPTMTEEAIGEDHFLHYDLHREGMIGAQFGEISALSMEKVHIDIFASAAGSVTFRLITNENPAINVPKTLQLEALKWNSFDIDLADFGEGHDWSTLYQFAIEKYQAGGLVGEHISVDNIYLYRTTALVDTEKPTDVTGSLLSASYFNVTLALSAKDNSGVVSFVVKDSEQEMAVGGGASGATVNVTVNGLEPNTEYTFSVIAKDEAGNEAAPIDVIAKTLAAPAAAPVPDLSGKVAVPVFCDALDGGPAINIGAWGQQTVSSFAELEGSDHVYFGSKFNYVGWELTPAVNATGMKYLHVDFYSPNITSISITPISPDHEGEKALALEANKWNSFDIELTAYDGKAIAWENIFQFKFFNAAPAGGELFIDNVYFYIDSTETAIDEVVESIPVRKEIKNGVLYIIRDNVRYTVTGMIVR